MIELNEEQTIAGLSKSNTMCDVLLEVIGDLKVPVSKSPHILAAYNWLEALKGNIQAELTSKLPKKEAEPASEA